LGAIILAALAPVLHANPEAGIIWVDAHADINTPTTSSSGNIHGMPVAFLLNLENMRSIAGFDWMKRVPQLDPSRIVYIGLRDVDPGERTILKNLGIKAFSMNEVDKHGIANVMDMAIHHVVGREERPIHLSFDLDSVAPLIAASTGTRVRGGLTYREAFYIMESCAESSLLCSLDLVEVNPGIGTELEIKETVDMALGLIRTALGNKIV